MLVARVVARQDRVAGAPCRWNGGRTIGVATRHHSAVERERGVLRRGCVGHRHGFGGRCGSTATEEREGREKERDSHVFKSSKAVRATEVIPSTPR